MSDKYEKCLFCEDGELIGDVIELCTKCNGVGWNLDSSINKEDILTINGDLSTGMDEIYTVFYKCPRCGEEKIFNDFHYCPMCGQRIEVEFTGGNDEN